MTVAPWKYPPEFMAGLESAGLRPTAATPPELARGYLNDLYRFELRRLRDRHRAGEIARVDYIDHVIAMRKKYWLLALSVKAWERICMGDG